MPKTSDAYASLADLYDLLTREADIQSFYREWREALLRAIEEKKVPVRTLADLACGTGNTTIPWTRRRGWKVLGVDMSRAMLRVAQRKSDRVRWLCQDIRKLNLREPVDVMTCHFDALNHILDSEHLQRVFTRVSETLHDGGLFQFDLNTEYWFRWLNLREKLFRIGPNYLIASNEYDAARRIVTFHHLWFVPNGRTYGKREIKVRERAYEVAEIGGMLKEAGLKLLKVESQRKLEGKPIRLLYLVQKPRSRSGMKLTSGEA